MFTKSYLGKSILTILFVVVVSLALMPTEIRVSPDGMLYLDLLHRLAEGEPVFRLFYIGFLWVATLLSEHLPTAMGLSSLLAQWFLVLAIYLFIGQQRGAFVIAVVLLAGVSVHYRIASHLVPDLLVASLLLLYFGGFKRLLEVCETDDSRRTVLYAAIMYFSATWSLFVKPTIYFAIVASILASTVLWVMLREKRALKIVLGVVLFAIVSKTLGSITIDVVAQQGNERHLSAVIDFIMGIKGPADALRPFGYAGTLLNNFGWAFFVLAAFGLGATATNSVRERVFWIVGYLSLLALFYVLGVVNLRANQGAVIFYFVVVASFVAALRVKEFASTHLPLRFHGIGYLVIALPIMIAALSEPGFLSRLIERTDMGRFSNVTFIGSAKRDYEVAGKLNEIGAERVFFDYINSKLPISNDLYFNRPIVFLSGVLLERSGVEDVMRSPVFNGAGSQIIAHHRWESMVGANKLLIYRSALPQFNIHWLDVSLLCSARGEPHSFLLLDSKRSAYIVDVLTRFGWKPKFKLAGSVSFPLAGMPNELCDTSYQYLSPTLKTLVQPYLAVH